MRIRSSIYACSAVLALSAFFAPSAQGQAPSSSSASVEQEIENVRAENAAARELIKALADKIDKLQRRLDGEPATVVHESSPPTPPTQPLSTTPLVAQPAIITATREPPQAALGQVASTSGSLESAPAPQTNDDRYRDGIVIWETGESAK